MTAEPLRVLLVEDNAADARLVEEMLKGSGRTPVAPDFSSIAFYSLT
jgi:CheY-like chemotaxis protein